jgi:hypothetical protein
VADVRDAGAGASEVGDEREPRLVREVVDPTLEPAGAGIADTLADAVADGHEPDSPIHA